MSRRKQAPNIDERILAGKALINPYGIKGLNIEPEDIQDGKCRRVLATIQRLHVQGRIPDNGNLGIGWLQQLENEGGGPLEVLSGLVDEAVSGDNLSYFAHKVKEPAIWRRIQRECEDGKDPEKVKTLLSLFDAPIQSGMIPGLNILPASELITQKKYASDWIVQDILTHPGTSILGSKPKVGKTTFARYLGLSVARGHWFLNRETMGAPVPVVYFAFEGDPDRFIEELQRLDVTDEPFYAHLGPAPQNFTDLLDAVITKSCPALIIVDTLFKALRIEKIKDYEIVLPHLERVEWIARSRRCHVMFIHHARKGDGGNLDADELLGSVAFAAGVDTIILLKKHPYGRTFRTEQRYGENLPETLIQLNSDGSLTTGQSVYEAEMEATWKEIESVTFTGRNNLTEADILDRAPNRYRKGEIQKALRWALKEGLIDRIGGGKRGNPYQYRLFVSDVQK